MREMVDRFKKNGVELEVFVNLDEHPFRLYITNGKHEAGIIQILERSPRGYFYKIGSKEAELLFGMAFPKKYVCIGSERAKEAKKKAYRLWLEHQEKQEIQTDCPLEDDVKIQMWFSPIHTHVRCKNDNASHYYYFKETAELIRTSLDEPDITGFLERPADDVILRDIGSTWLYEITYDEYKRLVELAKKRKKAKEWRKKKREQDIEEKIQNSIKLAKEIGEPIVINYYTEDCNDSNRNCNLDIVTEYALPDGTIEVIRTHFEVE